MNFRKDAAEILQQGVRLLPDSFTLSAAVTDKSENLLVITSSPLSGYSAQHYAVLIVVLEGFLLKNIKNRDYSSERRQQNSFLFLGKKAAGCCYWKISPYYWK